jgi:Family of unknown function (DUF5906)
MTNMRTPPTTLTDPLDVLQSRYALFKGSGEIWVVSRNDIDRYRQGGHKAPEMMGRAPGSIMMKRDLEALSIPFQKPDEVVRQLFTDPRTHLYEEIAFSPINQPPTTLNLWREPPIQPKRGNWKLIRRHLFEVICSNDRAQFSFLIRFLAHMVQKPEEKPGVMIVLLGKQGTGKGALFQLLARIWRHSVLQVSDVDQVVGKFNAPLGRSYVVCMDEALFTHDRKAQDRLKSLITEPVISVEEKYQPQHSIDSYHRFFAASNHDHFAQVDPDDRRYFMLRVSEKYKQNEAYFAPLFDELSSVDAVAGFLSVLTNIDLSGFNPRSAPKTTVHAEQRLLSLIRFERYWYRVLWDGQLPEFDNYTFDWTQETFVATEKLASAATKADLSSCRLNPIASQEVSKVLGLLCPSAVSSRRSVGTPGSQRRGFDLPPLKIARAEFERAKGITVDWDETSDQRPCQPLNATASGCREVGPVLGFQKFAKQARLLEIKTGVVGSEQF